MDEPPASGPLCWLHPLTHTEYHPATAAEHYCRHCCRCYRLAHLRSSGTAWVHGRPTSSRRQGHRICVPAPEALLPQLLPCLPFALLVCTKPVLRACMPACRLPACRSWRAGVARCPSSFTPPPTALLCWRGPGMTSTPQRCTACPLPTSGLPWTGGMDLTQTWWVPVSSWA